MTKTQEIVDSLIDKIYKNCDPQHLSITGDMLNTAKVYQSLTIYGGSGHVKTIDGENITHFSGYDLKLKFSVEEKVLVDSLGGVVVLERVKGNQFKLY